MISGPTPICPATAPGAPCNQMAGPCATTSGAAAGALRSVPCAAGRPQRQRCGRWTESAHWLRQGKVSILTQCESQVQVRWPDCPAWRLTDAGRRYADGADGSVELPRHRSAEATLSGPPPAAAPAVELNAAAPLGVSSAVRARRRRVSPLLTSPLIPCPCAVHTQPRTRCLDCGSSGWGFESPRSPRHFPAALVVPLGVALLGATSTADCVCLVPFVGTRWPVRLARL
jgi:hypothetical protein